MSRQAPAGGHACEDTSGEGLVPRMHKEPSPLRSEKAMNPCKMWNRPEQTRLRQKASEHLRRSTARAIRAPP